MYKGRGDRRGAGVDQWLLPECCSIDSLMILVVPICGAPSLKIYTV